MVAQETLKRNIKLDQALQGTENYDTVTTVIRFYIR